MLSKMIQNFTSNNYYATHRPDQNIVIFVNVEIVQAV